MREEQRLDRRVERTREHVLEAFRDVVLAGDYDGISVSGIASRANVGRSTFYENFENKEDVLRQSMTTVLEPLADTVTGRHDPVHLLHVVEHVADRRMRPAAMSAEVREMARQLLAAAIGERLERERRVRGLIAALPISLAAAEIAALQMGLLDAWVQEPADASAAQIATALAAASRAVVERVLTPG